MMHNDIHIMGIPGEESKQGIENISEEIMTKNFPSLVKKKYPQVQGAQRVPNRVTQRGLHQDTSYIKWQGLKTSLAS